MKIAIDIDEVVVKTIEGYLKFMEKKGFKRVLFEDISAYSLWEFLEMDKGEQFATMNEYLLSKEFKNVDFVKGAREGVGFLIKNHEVFFITSRSEKIIKVTRDFIFKNFNILGNRVFFSGDYYGNAKTKDEICEDMGIKIIIEDSGGDSLKYAKNGIGVLLLDKPWNQGFKHENIIRCFNWGDILDKIKGIENEEVF